MEWPKLKNLIILILVMVNGFLLVLAASRRGEAERYDRLALEQTVQVLEEKGIQVDAQALSPAQGLTPVSLERDLAWEARLVGRLLGEEVQGDNRGGGLYLYQGELGEVSLRAGGEVSARFEADSRWETDRPEQHAAALLRELGLEAEQTSLEDGEDGLCLGFRQSWNGAPVFSCEVELVYRDGRLRTLRGVLLLAETAEQEPGNCLSLPTALMRFSEEVAATGDVCTAIRSMQAGYRGSVQSLSGGTRLAPVWLVSTNTADYYLDCAAGALSRRGE